MRSRFDQMKRRSFYTGLPVATYHGTKTQPGYAGRDAGSKLARKAGRNRVGARVVGVVSIALDNISRGKRAPEITP